MRFPLFKVMLHSWSKPVCDMHNVVGPSGQFYHGIEYEVSDLRPGEVPEKPDATMYVKGRQLNVTRYTCDGHEPLIEHSRQSI